MLSQGAVETDPVKSSGCLKLCTVNCCGAGTGEPACQSHTGLPVPHRPASPTPDYSIPPGVLPAKAWKERSPKPRRSEEARSNQIRPFEAKPKVHIQ
jgi:hypothetical protein